MGKFTPGALIKLRNREWIVLPSNDPDLILIKPLNGSEEETTGIFLPLSFREDKPESYDYPPPKFEDLGNFNASLLLYNAARLSFRNVSGPFRCLGKLSFRPRSYQLVPLIMALKLNTIRLLIADDVGIGKTIEALIIVRELLDRSEIKSFAVICPPHLCDQWQQELRDKFSIDAIVIRTSTAASLERNISGDESIFQHYPYQVISIDYIKTDKKKNTFLVSVPDLVIVDEVHTCAKPAGASVNQQLRYSLLNEIAKNDKQHLVLLTATPHSGKNEEFQSLLGLLNKEYETIDLANAVYEQRKKVAANLVIRRRGDIEQWNEKTPFPKRDSKEIEYNLHQTYLDVFNQLYEFFIKFKEKKNLKTQQDKFQIFSFLSLLRGVMSSPEAGIAMLNNKVANKKIELDAIDFESNDTVEFILDKKELTDDYPEDIVEKTNFIDDYSKFFSKLSEKLIDVKDTKAEIAYKTIKDWINEGYNTVVFCRFIATAKYFFNYLRDKFTDDVRIELVTGEIVDEERKERVENLKNYSKKILVATDCLSEGINLQEHFTAVLHYDLPWNPNRLEQREGRIDRFGQSASEVKAYLLWGGNNPVDAGVLNVLLKKAREIKKQTGISVPFPMDNESMMDSILSSVLSKNHSTQLTIDFAGEINEYKINEEYNKAIEREKSTRSVFSQHSIKVDEIRQDLNDIDTAIGTPETVEYFVTTILKNLQAEINKIDDGYILNLTNVPYINNEIFDNNRTVKISFISPTPKGFIYIGRNHNLVDRLSLITLNKALEDDKNKEIGARAAVIAWDKAKIKTTILLLRIRMIIEEINSGNQLVAEEMVLFGFKGELSSNLILSHKECEEILKVATPTLDISMLKKEVAFNYAIKQINENKEALIKITEERTQKLLEANTRYRNILGGKKNEFVKPILPPDILGVYIILPGE